MIHHGEQQDVGHGSSDVPQMCAVSCWYGRRSSARGTLTTVISLRPWHVAQATVVAFDAWGSARMCGVVRMLSVWVPQWCPAQASARQVSQGAARLGGRGEFLIPRGPGPALTLSCRRSRGD